jgi:hypothetical protein
LRFIPDKNLKKIIGYVGPATHSGNIFSRHTSKKSACTDNSASLKEPMHTIILLISDQSTCLFNFFFRREAPHESCLEWIALNLRHCFSGFSFWHNSTRKATTQRGIASPNPKFATTVHQITFELVELAIPFYKRAFFISVVSAPRTFSPK